MGSNAMRGGATTREGNEKRQGEAAQQGGEVVQ